VDPERPVFEVAQEQLGRAAALECLEHRPDQSKLLRVGLAFARKRRRNLGQHGTGGLAPGLGLHLGKGADRLESLQPVQVAPVTLDPVHLYACEGLEPSPETSAATACRTGHRA
jgi:hypothetical protein